MSVFEGLPPLVDEPVRGEDGVLVERIGELVAQRRRVDALLHGGAVTDAAAASLTAAIDGRIAALASRLGEEPGASTGSPGRPAKSPDS